MDNKAQEIYINLDDSGKLTTKEKICAYGGIVFSSKKEKDKFITQYRSIINKIKCNYCRNNLNNCNKNCPEIKNTNISNADKRWLMNYIKRYYVVALVIKNELIYDHIKDNKSAKGRFLDYSIRRMIKEIVKCHIQNKIIDPNKMLKIIINIDQQSTKSNGYYNLHDGLIEELKYGINNFNYANIISPIIKGNLEIKITYQNSRKSYVIQAADLLAGSIRKEFINSYNNEINIISDLNRFINIKLILP